MGPLQQRPGHPATHQSYRPADHCKEGEVTFAQKTIPHTQITPVRSISLAHVASLPFSQPPAPTLPMSPPLTVSLDLCFTGPLKHPRYHHHMPLARFSARAGIGRENVHSTAVGPLSGPFEVTGISYIPPPQSSLITGFGNLSLSSSVGWEAGLGTRTAGHKRSHSQPCW